MGVIRFILVIGLSAGFIHSQDLRCVSYNIWTGLDYEGMLKMGEYESKQVRETRYQGLLKEMRELDPHIIALNEVNYLPGSARRLARDLDMDQIFAFGNTGLKILGLGIPTNLREGEVILAKPELELKLAGRHKLSGDRISIQNRFLSIHFKETHFLLLGRVNWQDQDIYIANVHLHASILMDPELDSLLQVEIEGGKLQDIEYGNILDQLDAGVQRRVDEVSELFDYLHAAVPKDAPIILMGDFNDIPGSLIHEMITLHAGYLDTYAAAKPDLEGYTWYPQINTNIDPLQTEHFLDKDEIWSRMDLLDYRSNTRIDYVFVTPRSGLTIKDSQVVFKTPYDGIMPSDHLGVITILEF